MENQTIQKQQLRILDQYNSAIHYLEIQSYEQGAELLKLILNNPIIYSHQLSALRYSIYMSLAQVCDIYLKNANQAIYYLYKALQIKQDFIQWKKLSTYCRKNGYLDSAEYALKKSMNLCSCLIKNALLEQLVEIKLLKAQYRAGLELVNLLIKQNYNLKKILSKKLYCLYKILQTQNQTEEIIIQVHKLESMKVKLDDVLDQQRQKILILQKNQVKCDFQPQKKQDIRLKIEIGPKTTWSNFLAKIYLLFKREYSNEDIPKKGTNNKFTKLMTDYFINRPAYKNAFIRLQLVQKLNDENQILQNLSQNLLNLEMKKNKESISKVISTQQQKKVVIINGNINLKDYLGNQTVHINSLIHLLAKHKRKDLTKVKILKQLNQILSPKEDFYLQVFKTYENDIKTIQFLNQKSQIQTINIDEQQNNQKQDAIQQQVESKTVESVYRLKLQQDFLQFIGKGKSYINLIQLIQNIIQIFLCNQQRIVSQKLLILMKQNGISENNFIPSYFLRNTQDTFVKYHIVKLIIRCQILYKGLLKKDQLKVTVLELLVEKYTEICNKPVNKNKQIIEILKKKKNQIKNLIIKMQGELINPKFNNYLATLTIKQQILIKIRVYHTLVMFYSLADHQCQIMLNRLLPKYETELSKYKQISGEKCISLFWLENGYTKQNLRQFIEKRLKQNKLKIEIQHKQIDFTGQIVSVLQNSILNFKKRKQKSVGEAIQLYYKNILELMMDESLPYHIFLLNLIEIIGLYLQIAQNKPAKEDHSRHIIKLDESMKIQELIQYLIKKSQQQERKQNFLGFMREFLKLSNYFLKILLMKYFILENEGHNNQVLKGLLLCLTYEIKIMNKQMKNKIIPEILIFLHFLIHIPTENISIHKKYFTHFAHKFMEYLYNDKRIITYVQRQIDQIEQQPEEDEVNFYQQARQLLNCFYGFTLKKVNQFSPINFKDIQNFVKYVKAFHTQYFTTPSSKIKLPINNILRNCEKILKESKKQTTFCPSFQQVRKKITDLYQRDKRDQQFLTQLKNSIIIPKQKFLCNCKQTNCFTLVRQNNPSLLDIYYIISKSLQNDQFTDNQIQKTQIQKVFRHSQRFYLSLICFCVNSPKYWYCLSKINKKKAFIYFDSLVYEQNFNEWKNAFIFSKKISSIIKQIFPAQQISDIRQQIQEDNFILNLLKIEQRKFLYLQSRQPGQIVQSEITKQRKVKLLEGYTAMVTKLQIGDNLKIQYLSIIFLKIPYFWLKPLNLGDSIKLIDQLLSVIHKLGIQQQQDRNKLQKEQVQGELYFFIYKITNKYVKLMRRLQNKQLSAQILKILSQSKQCNLNFITNLIKSEFNNFFKTLEKIMPQLFLPKLDDDNNYLKTSYSSILSPIKQVYKNNFRQFILITSKNNKKPKDDGTVQKYFNFVIANLKVSIFNLTQRNINKKTKLQRFYARCCYFLSKIQLKIQNDPQKATSTLNQIVNIKLDDIVLIYRYYQNQSLEKDLKLSQFFNRNLYFLLCKFRYIRYLIKLLYEVCDYERIRHLFKKLLKLIPRDESPPRANKIFVMLHKICLIYSIESLKQLINKNLLTQQSQKWLYELYEKYIKPKKIVKNENIEKIKQLLVKYGEKNMNGEQNMSVNSKLEKGVSILEQKYKKKKGKESVESKA